MDHLWADKYNKTEYVTIVGHYMTPEMHMKSHVLCTSEFPAEDAKYGLHIRREILYELESYDISATVLEGATFLRDQAANIRSVLSPFKCLPCISHCIAIVIHHVLDKEKFLKESVPQTL